MSLEPGLYQRVMGEAAFAALPAAVQRFHRLAGAHELAGWVVVEAPASGPARLLARALGTPTAAWEGPLSFRLEAQPLQELWTRRFPAHTLVSRLSFRAGALQESMGPARLQFGLRVEPGKLVMQLQGLRFLGLPCPGWLRPTVLAEESGDQDRLCFVVRAAVPGMGQVAGYRGWLAVPSLATSKSGGSGE